MKKNNCKPLAGKGVHETILRIISNLDIKCNGKVLDAAAGQGFLSKKLFELGFEVYPVDINPLQFFFNKLKCEKVDLNRELPFKNNFFDLIVSVESIEHLENPWDFIKELYRVLKPGGRLILTTPNITNIFSRLLFLISGRFILFSKKTVKNKYHIMPLPKWLIEGILENKNFLIEKITCSKGWFPILRKYFSTKNLLFGHVLIISAKKSVDDHKIF